MFTICSLYSPVVPCCALLSESKPSLVYPHITSTMYSILRKSFVPAKGFTQRALSDSAFMFEKGSKVSLMGTNTARANILGAIEKAEAQAVRLTAVPQDAHNTTVTAYLQKEVPEGANVQKVGDNMFVLLCYISFSHVLLIWCPL